MAPRARVRTIVDSSLFDQVIIAVIVINAATLGLEASSTAATARYATVLDIAELAALSVFVVELGLRIYAHGLDYFRRPWNWFDVLLVAISFLPSFETVLALRALRILRSFRLVSLVPSMRRVVSGLVRAIPGLASILFLLLLILYTFAVISTRLFGSISPEYFGTLGTSLFTLFQLMTTEGWPDVAASVMSKQPWAWVFFVVYIVGTAFVLLNLVIGVIVSAMEKGVSEGRWAEDEAVEARQHEEVVTELRALRAELAELREHTMQGSR